MQQHLTREGIEQLTAELEHLKVQGRSEMAERIRAAREFGDLSENAEYDIAKEEQAKMEVRILELEQILASAIVYEKPVKSDVVGLGSTVVLQDLALKKEVTYELVGSHQANPFENRISYDCPLGRSLMDKKKGDTITVKTAKKGEMKYKILKIK